MQTLVEDLCMLYKASLHFQAEFSHVINKYRQLKPTEFHQAICSDSETQSGERFERLTPEEAYLNRKENPG